MIACRRRGAFCKGVVSTPSRRGPTFVRAKVGKTRSRGTDSPLTNPFLSLAVLDTNLDFSGAKNPNPYCAQIRSQGSRRRICPTALRCPKKSSRCSLARFFRPLRVLRLAASATGGARLRTPYPSPVAGKGPSGQIAACSTHRLDSVTSCNRFAGTKLKCACGSLSASSNPAPGMRSVSGREGSDA